MDLNPVRWWITLIAILFAIIHLFVPNVEIDEITLILLVLAAMPWLAPFLKSVELFGAKIEARDFKESEKKVENSGLVEVEREPQRQNRHIYSFEAVSGDDPNLLLAGLRIEIESRLRKIAENRNIKAGKFPLRRLTHELVKSGALNSVEAASIEDLLPLLNKAVHGARVDKEVTESALKFGPRLLDALENRIGETDIPKLVEQWKNGDGAAVAEVGTELSKALVRSPQAFFQVMQGDPETYDSWLQGIAQHTFTIYESRDEVEDDLYMAYYHELKEQMVRASESLLGGEFEEEANRALQMLRSIEVSKIW